MKLYSNRQLRAAELIKQALIDVLRKGRMLDPRLIDSHVTVSEVQISADLKIATCFVLNFPQSKLSEKDLLEALEASKYAIRNLVTRKVQLKYSAELRFKYDHSFDYMSELQSILN